MEIIWGHSLAKSHYPTVLKTTLFLPSNNNHLSIKSNTRGLRDTEGKKQQHTLNIHKCLQGTNWLWVTYVSNVNVNCKWKHPLVESRGHFKALMWSFYGFPAPLGPSKQTFSSILGCSAALSSPHPGWDTGAGSGGCQTRPAGPPGGSCTRLHEQQPHNLRKKRDEVSCLRLWDGASLAWKTLISSVTLLVFLDGSTLCCLHAPGSTEAFPHLTLGCLVTRLIQEIITVSWQLLYLCINAEQSIQHAVTPLAKVQTGKD